MPAIRGITVAVGSWYARTLSICLARNMRHLTECLVVTKPGDPCVDVARSVPGVRVFETDVFTRGGARFNKGWAMELGFSELGRDGWICVLDADVILPDHLPLERLRPDALHGAKRRVLEDVDRWSPGLDWQTCMPLRDGGPIGFLQIFNADAPAIRDVRPWYGVNFPHAGGGDAFLLDRFKQARAPIVMLPTYVLHLGPVDTNWFGADPEGRDMMAAYVHRMGWTRAMRTADPTAVDRVPETPDRVDVPGYETSSYVMPFERRARQRASGG